MCSSYSEPLFTLILTYFCIYEVDGGYGNWSLKGTCNVTCGEGLERWSRKCNNPEPKYGGRNCSHLGESVEHRICAKKPCVGKYKVPVFLVFGGKQMHYSMISVQTLQSLQSFCCVNPGNYIFLGRGTLHPL